MSESSNKTISIINPLGNAGVVVHYSRKKGSPQEPVDVYAKDASTLYSIAAYCRYMGYGSAYVVIFKLEE